MLVFKAHIASHYRKIKFEINAFKKKEMRNMSREIKTKKCITA